MIYYYYLWQSKLVAQHVQQVPWGSWNEVQTTANAIKNGEEFVRLAYATWKLLYQLTFQMIDLSLSHVWVQEHPSHQRKGRKEKQREPLRTLV